MQFVHQAIRQQRSELDDRVGIVVLAGNWRAWDVGTAERQELGIGCPEILHRQSVLAVDQIVAIGNQLMFGEGGSGGIRNWSVYTVGIGRDVELPIGELRIQQRQGHRVDVRSVASHLNTRVKEGVVCRVARMIGGTQGRSDVSRRAIGRQWEQIDSAGTAG